MSTAAERFAALVGTDKQPEKRVIKRKTSDADLLLARCIDDPELTMQDKGIMAMLVMLEQKYRRPILRRLILNGTVNCVDVVRRSINILIQHGYMDAYRAKKSYFCRTVSLTPEQRKEYRKYRGSVVSLTEFCIADATITYAERGLYAFLLAHEFDAGEPFTAAYATQFAADSEEKIVNFKKSLIAHDYLRCYMFRPGGRTYKGAIYSLIKSENEAEQPDFFRWGKKYGNVNLRKFSDSAELNAYVKNVEHTLNQYGLHWIPDKDLIVCQPNISYATVKQRTADIDFDAMFEQLTRRI